METQILSPMPNKIWSKFIPYFNYICGALYLLIIFGVDLVLIFNASLGAQQSYWPFWYIMLVFLGFYIVFFLLEGSFGKKLSNTTSKLDGWIFTIIILRNIIFLLNFLPFIQLLGLVVDFFGGWILIIVYIRLMFLRFREAKQNPALTSS